MCLYNFDLSTHIINNINVNSDVNNHFLRYTQMLTFGLGTKIKEISNVWKKK